MCSGRPTGRDAVAGWRRVALAAFLLLLWLPAQADVTAIVDRQQIALGDSFRLIITSTDGEDLDDIDFRDLERRFDILQRSSSSQTSIVNGSLSRTQQLQLDLAARETGRLQIPALEVDGVRTHPITIKVAKPAPTGPGGQVVVVEAEVDRDTVYVQGQLLLTLRIMQAINLDNRSISPFELENAFVRELEQQSYQRNIDGRTWLVHELRYAIFPEQSGTLEIPAQTFTAREAVPRRSLFDLGGGGRRLQRSSRPLTIEVLPRPREFPSTEWLPARSLTIEEQWSTPPEQLKAGESATRTLRLRGEGLQGAQLPPVLFQPVEGVKFYPDQPSIDEQEVSTGLLGLRRDRAALVPTKAGTLSLPEVRIPWWDTESETVRFAVLPARDIVIAPADPATVPTSPAATPLDNPAASAPGESGSALLWQLVAAGSTLGWLLTIAWLLWRERGKAPARVSSPDNVSERREFKQLQQACGNNDAKAARAAVIAWTAALSADSTVTALADVSSFFGDTHLQAEIAQLDSTLYREEEAHWNGAGLAPLCKELRKTHLDRSGETDTTLSLYPQS